MNATTPSSRTASFRTAISAAIVLLALGAACTSASAQTPTATGTVRYANNAGWATFQLFPTTSNTFGFFARISYHGDHVLTVVPFNKLADGNIECWFIDYMLVGATNPNQTQGWQWVETAGGRLTLAPSTATASSIAGTMGWTYTGTQNYQRQPINNPQFFQVIFTVP